MPASSQTSSSASGEWPTGSSSSRGPRTRSSCIRPSSPPRRSSPTPSADGNRSRDAGRSATRRRRRCVSTWSGSPSRSTRSSRTRSTTPRRATGSRSAFAARTRTPSSPYATPDPGSPHPISTGSSGASRVRTRAGAVRRADPASGSPSSRRSRTATVVGSTSPARKDRERRSSSASPSRRLNRAGWRRHSRRSFSAATTWSETRMRAWPLDPLLIAGLIVSGAIYLRADRRVRARRGGVLPGTRPWWFVGGLSVILVSLQGPLDARAGTSFTAHMVQHLLLTMVAAPLLVLGAPIALALLACTPAARRRLVSVLRTPPVRVATNPIFAWGLFVVVLWGTHFTDLYSIALRNNAVHAVEHLLYLGAAVLFWIPVVG